MITADLKKVTLVDGALLRIDKAWERFWELVWACLVYIPAQICYRFWDWLTVDEKRIFTEYGILRCYAGLHPAFKVVIQLVFIPNGDLPMVYAQLLAKSHEMRWFARKVFWLVRVFH